MSFLHLVFFIASPSLAGRSDHVYFDSRSLTTSRLVDVDGGRGGLSSSLCFTGAGAGTGLLHSLLFDDNFLYGDGRGGRNVPVRSRYLSVDPFFRRSKIVKLLSVLPGRHCPAPTLIERQGRPHLDLSSALLAD